MNYLDEIIMIQPSEIDTANPHYHILPKLTGFNRAVIEQVSDNGGALISTDVSTEWYPISQLRKDEDGDLYCSLWLWEQKEEEREKD